MNCSDRKDLILAFAADALDGAEADELRAHLATGCPECAGALAEAQALIALIPLGIERVAPRRELRGIILNRVHAETRPHENMRMRQDRIGPTPLQTKRGWETSVIPASLAAILAVALTLLAVSHFYKGRGSESDPASISEVRRLQIEALQAQLGQSQDDLEKMRKSVEGMKIAQLTGATQPEALGRVFVDAKNAKWYFFTSGMKPPAGGKTYELWLISDGQKIPAGTFDVNEHGTATLLGSVPTLPPGAAISMAVTDEPAGGTAQPTGSAQISGKLQ